MSRGRYFGSCMDDCIHLHACRRVQAIGKSHRLLVPRYCDENCDCYLSGDENSEFVSIETAINYARNGVERIRSGWDSYDVYLTEDLLNKAATINEILEENE